MYIRLKRKNMTMFLHVEPSDNFYQIKTRIGENFGLEASNILLFAGDKVSAWELVTAFDFEMLWSCSQFKVNFCLLIFIDVLDVQKREFVDLATVSDQEVRNDDVLYMVFPKETGSGWEELQADTLVPFGDDGDSSSP